MRQKVENCKVIEVSRLETGSTSKGDWKKLTLVVQKEFENDFGDVSTIDLALTAFNKVCDQIMTEMISIGDTVNIAYKVSSKKIDKKDGSKMWITEASLGRLELVAKGNQPTAPYQNAGYPVPPQPMPTPTTPAPSTQPADDMPF